MRVRLFVESSTTDGNQSPSPVVTVSIGADHVMPSADDRASSQFVVPVQSTPTVQPSGVLCQFHHAATRPPLLVTVTLGAKPQSLPLETATGDVHVAPSVDLIA